MFRLFFKIVNVFWNFRFEQCAVRMFRIVRTLWISPCFKSFGKDTRIGKFEKFIGLQFVSIGSRVTLNDYIYLTAWTIDKKKMPEIRIGDDCNFGAFNHITAINKIYIGNNVLTGKCVTITDNSHGEISVEGVKLPPAQRPIVSKGPVIIEDNVWIGDKATILPNVHIGKNAIVGANSVVTHDVPAFAVVAGNPAQIIKLLK